MILPPLKAEVWIIGLVLFVAVTVLLIVIGRYVSYRVYIGYGDTATIEGGGVDHWTSVVCSCDSATDCYRKVCVLLNIHVRAVIQGPSGRHFQ